MRRRNFTIAAASTLVALAGLWQGMSPLQARANTHVQHAAFTTIDPNVDSPPAGGQLCLNGNPGVNCNIYTDKQFVWMNGGRTVTAVVDDRGPYVAGREWDLNQNTAAALGFTASAVSGRRASA